MKKYISLIVSVLFLSGLAAQSANMQNTPWGTTGSKKQAAAASDSLSGTQSGAASGSLPSTVARAQLAMSTSDYLVTSGDIYSLSFVVNSTPVTYDIFVDSSYKIRVANITVLDASGKTFLQLKRLVEQIVTENYHLSGVQFVLTSPALFTVKITGEVHETTVKQADALTRLDSVLNGIETPYSSERDVTVTSESGEKKTYDLFKASRTGDMSQNPYVRPGDTITVNRMSRKVTIDGAVERPGTYELLPGENLKELVNYYANGIQELGDPSRIELSRQIDETDKPGKKIYLDQKSIDDDYPLLCYDGVYVSSYTELKPVMFIEGALYLPSSSADDKNSVSANGQITPESSAHIPVSFQSGENYAFLIRRMRSLFSSFSDIENAFIIRKGEHIQIDVTQCLYDASYYSTQFVQPYDTLMIPFKQTFVSVAGAVTTPGRYPYIPGRDWEYYIGLAGGFIVDKNFNQTVTIKDLNGKVMKKSDPIAPETTITAATNSFTYYFGKYSPVITVLLSAISATATLIAVLN